jgi:hypothetical protein
VLPRRRAVILAALAALAALSILLRVPFLPVPLTSDEGGYAYTARWLDRGLALYRDLWFDRPQAIFLVYSAILHLVGPSTEAIRLGAGLYNAATLFTPRAALAAAALFAVASASPAIEGFTANGELFMNLPVVASVLLAVRGRWLLAGLALALATAIKPTALPTAAPALALLQWPPESLPCLTRRRPRAAPGNERSVAISPVDAPGSRQPEAQGDAGARGRAARSLLTGLAMGLAPFVAHGVATNLDDYAYAVAGFRITAHSAFSVGAAFVGDLWPALPMATVGILPLWILGVVAVRTKQRRAGDGGRPMERGVAVSLALLAGSLVGAALGGYWYWHYFVGVLPAASLLAGRGVEALSELPAGRRRVLAAASVAAGIVALIFNLRFVGATPEETSWLLYRRPAYLVSARIAQYLRQHTGPHDRVYAAFAEADLYYLSDRRSADRHLYWTEINRVPGAFEALLDALDNPLRRPKYVVAIDHELEKPGRAAAFWQRIERLYVPETRIGGFTLYRAKDDEDE